MRYYVIQFSRNQDGENKTSVYTFDNETAALKTWYGRCAADIDDMTKSNALDMVVREDGYVIASKQFNHENEEETAVNE